MSSADKAALMLHADELRRHQLEPDSPEDLAKIPMLAVSDMEPKAKFTPWNTKPVLPSVEPSSTEQIVSVDLATNGITYVALSYDLGEIPVRLLPALKILAQCITSLGTSKVDEIKMQHRIGASTGGVGASVSVSTVPGSRGQIHAKFTVSGSALHGQVDELKNIIVELLADANLDQRRRVTEILARSESARSSQAAESSALVQGYVSASLSAEGSAAMAMGGLPYLRWLRSTVSSLKKDGSEGEDAWGNLLAGMREARDRVLQQKNAAALVTTESAHIGNAEKMVSDILTSDAIRATDDWMYQPEDIIVKDAFGCTPRAAGVLDASALDWTPANFQPPSVAAIAQGKKIAVLAPTQVNYVVRSVPLPLDGQGNVSGLRTGSAIVAASIASTNYIWDQVRVVGNAYGGGMAFDSMKGVAGFSSYRDPNIRSTYEAYTGAIDYLRTVPQEDINKAIISTTGSLDAPKSAAGKGSKAFQRWIGGITEELVQQQREEVLSTTPADLRDFADVVQAAIADGQTREGLITTSELLRREGYDVDSDAWVVEQVYRN